MNEPNEEKKPTGSDLESVDRKRKILGEIVGEVSRCTKCQLHKSRTNPVSGAGNPSADIMFIGEAPGAEEDKQGIPFVGRAGKLLDKILAACELTRDDIYITNILKCRPPKNRDPLPAERTACMPYLLAQIDTIKPKVICCLGRIAAQSILQTKIPLGKLRGQVHRFRGTSLIVTYHPAAILRNENFKRPTWEDFKFLLKIVKEQKAKG
ncbi:uracil-DNA glycosylase [bacterium]|nr:uracil-DNA glycosylase [bacterium]